MSYEIYTQAIDPETIILLGQGEHEGTSETVNIKDLFKRYDRPQVASYLDRRFLLAHADRKMREVAYSAIANFAKAFAND